MRRCLLGGLVALTIAGCQKAEPPKAGGKPVSYWVDALKESDAKVRKKAAFKLGNVGPTDGAALPALLGALEDADPGVRCEAVLALMKFGPPAREAIPTLEHMKARDRNAQARNYASRA